MENGRRPIGKDMAKRLAAALNTVENIFLQFTTSFFYLAFFYLGVALPKIVQKFQDNLFQ